MDDLDGYEEFCVEAHPRLVGALSHHLGDHRLAEELAHEALIRAGDRWGQVHTLQSPLGWCFRVGVNLGRSQFRRRLAERRAMTRHGGRPDRHYDEDTSDRLAVQTALAQLTDKQRRAVVLRYHLGLTSTEAAEVLGTSPAAVRATLHRAIAALRTSLDLHITLEEAVDGA